MGICNGFQILTEAGLLPGALMRNANHQYICKQVHLKVETDDSPFTHMLTRGEVLRMPVGHAEGNYFCDAETLAQLKQPGPHRLPLRRMLQGLTEAEHNLNGSLENIAGVLSEGPQRARHDAASGPLQRAPARLRGRPQALPRHGRGARRTVATASVKAVAEF